MTTLQKNQSNNRQISIWLLFCAGMIFCMIILGGITRLTDSGLSMVEWKPLVGIIPPLNAQDWQDSFDKYKLFPEYQKVNKGMHISEYKSIFMYEYLHRILGRIIGVIFLIPFLFFYFTNRIKKNLTPKLAAIFILGGLQGLLGWYMVKSGLINNPDVSQYRLTAHLGNAVIIYSYILWVAFGLMEEMREPFVKSSINISQAIKTTAYTITALLFLMILSGGLVAGTRAGLAYSTFPLMGETFIPPGLYNMSPVWLSAFEDVTTIQFNHRMFAYILLVVISSFSFVGFYRLKSARLRAGLVCLIALLIAQVSLGIATIVMHVPLLYAAAHQGTAIALLTASLFMSSCFYGSGKKCQKT
ncbi:MAG: cytochrome c oxidase assembly protein subunit 15 [Saprospiraceae bacterium]|jgi:cytochrome c oxidase assembly protein subunit 15|tara:strand:+ start:469 stop:1542 length:1074 start_codon:yes stop_codon:yes gene_type:complete